MKRKQNYIFYDRFLFSITQTFRAPTNLPTFFVLFCFFLFCFLFLYTCLPKTHAYRIWTEENITILCVDFRFLLAILFKN